MTKRILIAEDDPLNMQLVREVLSMSGMQTIEAVDGLQAVELAAIEKPDLILMDMMMPKMNGFEATKRIRNNEDTAGIPIISLTASAMKGDVDDILAAGCDAYMSKPFKIPELLDLIREILSETEESVNHGGQHVES